MNQKQLQRESHAIILMANRLHPFKKTLMMLSKIAKKKKKRKILRSGSQEMDGTKSTLMEHDSDKDLH
jgi:hypothetical protein